MTTYIKVLLVLAPPSLLLFSSVHLLVRIKSIATVLLFVGSLAYLVTVLAYVADILELVPFDQVLTPGHWYVQLMRWGLQLATVCFAVGFFLFVCRPRHT